MGCAGNLVRGLTDGLKQALIGEGVSYKGSQRLVRFTGA